MRSSLQGSPTHSPPAARRRHNSERYISSIPIWSSYWRFLLLSSRPRSRSRLRISNVESPKPTVTSFAASPCARCIVSHGAAAGDGGPTNSRVYSTAHAKAGSAPLPSVLSPNLLAHCARPSVAAATRSSSKAGKFLQNEGVEPDARRLRHRRKQRVPTKRERLGQLFVAHSKPLPQPGGRDAQPRPNATLMPAGGLTATCAITR